jgi:hypothetical protein
MPAKSNNVHSADDCQSYLITTNRELSKQKDEHIKEISELEHKCGELEDEISKEEQKRVYMKGLMHNLYAFKTDSFTMVEYYDKSLKELYHYSEDMNFNIYSRMNPKSAIAWEFLTKFIHMVYLIPFVLNYFKLITMYEAVLINVHQFIPFACMYFYVRYYEKHIKITPYKEIKKSYIRNFNKINEIRDKIKELEDSCRSLDDYIDDI